MDYQGLMLDPIYNTLGVPGVIHVDTAESNIVVMDKSVPSEGNIGVETLSFLPHARVRVVEFLARGLNPDDIDGNTIVFNGVTWTIKSHQYVPSPNGRSDGELALILEEA